MIKIYGKVANDIVVFKNDKFENHLKDINLILLAVANITNEQPWKCLIKGKLVIELSVSDEDIESLLTSVQSVLQSRKFDNKPKESEENK